MAADARLPRRHRRESAALLPGLVPRPAIDPALNPVGTCSTSRPCRPPHPYHFIVVRETSTRDEVGRPRRAGATGYLLTGPAPAPPLFRAAAAAAAAAADTRTFVHFSSLLSSPTRPDQRPELHRPNLTSSRPGPFILSPSLDPLLLGRPSRGWIIAIDLIPSS